MTSRRYVFPCIAALCAALSLAGCSSADERAQSHLELGQKLEADGNAAKAAIEYRNALKFKPGFLPALLALGTNQEQQGNFQAAVRSFNDAAETATDNVDARLHLARIFLGAGNAKEALKYVEQAYASAPSDARVLALKAAVELRLGKTADAIEHANAALKVDPDTLDALMVLAAERLAASDPHAAMVFMDHATQKSDRDVALQMLRIRAFDILKDNAGIESALLKLVQYYPNNFNMRDGLVRWYLADHRKDDAEKVLRKYAADNPGTPQAELAVVNFLNQQNGPDAALSELSEQIKKGGDVFAYQLATAQLLLAQGKYDDAKNILAKLIADGGNPQNVVTAKIALARTLVSRKDWAGAKAQAESVLADDSRNVEALVVRGSIRLANGELVDAIQDLHSAMNEAPQSTAIMLLLAEAYERNGDVSLAEEQLANATRLEKRVPDAGLRYVNFLLRYGKTDQAERVLSDMRTTMPQDRGILTQLAQLKLAKGDWTGAQEIAAAVRKLGDASSAGSADQIVAAALNGQKKYENGIEVLEASKGASDGQPSVMAQLVATYVKAGKQDTAEQYLKSVIAADPKSVVAYALLGSVYIAGHHLEDAEATLKTAVGLDTGGSFARRELAKFYLAQGRLAEAEKTAREALDVAKNDALLHLLLAAILERSGQSDAAIAEYRSLYAADPLSTVVANNLASLLSENKTDQASLDEAYGIASRFRGSGVPQFLDTLGWILNIRGDHSQAVTLLQSAAEKMPNNGAVQFHLAMAYQGLGQLDLARQNLKQAIALSASNPAELARAQAALNAIGAAPAAPATDAGKH